MHTVLGYLHDKKLYKTNVQNSDPLPSVMYHISGADVILCLQIRETETLTVAQDFWIAAYLEA